MKTFILGYHVAGDPDLTEYTNKQQAEANSEEWAEVEANSLEEAKAKYEETHDKWQKSQQPKTASEKALEIGKILNVMGTRPSEIGKEIALKEHRYLQQEFWTLVEGFIKQQADNYSSGYYDDRNKYTAKICRRIENHLDKWREEIANERH